MSANLELPNLERALQLKPELDALRPLTREQEQLIWQKFRFDWNYHSNNIEGNSLTFGETKSLLLHNITAQGKPLKDHIEITGHNEAIDALLDVAKGDVQVTESLVRNLHRMILRERYQVAAQTAEGAPTRKWIEVGQYKSTPNHVLTATGELFRFAEPFEVPARMQALMQAVNAVKPGADRAAIVAAAKAHYDLVCIHPFDDGNGRMARLLMNLLLIKCGFPPAIVRTEDKANYFAALRQADGGQLDVFVEYIAACVVRSLEIMLAGARGKSIEDAGEQDRQIKMLEKLLENKVGGVAVTRTEDSVRRVYVQSVVPLVRTLIASASKFEKFYVAITPEVYLNGYDGKIDITLDPNAIRFSDSTSAIHISIQFTSLRYQGLDHNSYDWSVNFRLLLDSYSIDVMASLVKITKRYEQQITSEEINTIVVALKKEHIRTIEQAAGVTLSSLNGTTP